MLLRLIVSHDSETKGNTKETDAAPHSEALTEDAATIRVKHNPRQESTAKSGAAALIHHRRLNRISAATVPNNGRRGKSGAPMLIEIERKLSQTGYNPLKKRRRTSSTVMPRP